MRYRSVIRRLFVSRLFVAKQDLAVELMIFRLLRNHTSGQTFVFFGSTVGRLSLFHLKTRPTEARLAGVMPKRFVK